MLYPKSLLILMSTICLSAVASADPQYIARSLAHTQVVADINNYSEVIGTTFSHRAVIVRPDIDGYYTDSEIIGDSSASAGLLLNGLGDNVSFDFDNFEGSNVNFQFGDGRVSSSLNWGAENYSPTSLTEDGLIAGSYESSGASVRDAVDGSELTIPGMSAAYINNDYYLAANSSGELGEGEKRIKLFRFGRATEGPGEPAGRSLHFQEIPILNPELPAEARVVDLNDLGLLLIEVRLGKPGAHFRAWFHLYNIHTGSLTTIDDSRYAQLIPIALNNRGEVIGLAQSSDMSRFGGFVYRNGEISELINGIQGFGDIYPVALNDRGEILVYASDGVTIAYVLKPADPARQCVADLDGDSVVGLSDVSILLNRWGQPSGTWDLSGDRVLGLDDIGIMFQNWGACPA